MKRVAAVALLQLALAASASADLVNPSTLLIRETSPSGFTLELTLPVINGRVVRARPVLPESCVVADEPEVRGDAVRVIRTWTMRCDRQQLVGAPVGIQGLLGTSLDVLLTLETLDGRQYVRQLRATQAYFVIPPPPTLGELALHAGRRGAERVVQRPELVLLIMLSMLLGVGRWALFIALFAFSAAQGLGQWLGGERWMAMATFLPQMMVAAAAWLLAVELMGRRVLQSGWLRPLWLPMLLLGLLYGAAQPEVVSTVGLSSVEQSLSLVLFEAGALAGLSLLALWGHQLGLILAGLGEDARRRWSYRVGYVAAVLAGGVFFYQASAPLFTGAIAPVVPLVSLVTAAVLGLWSRCDYAAGGPSLAMLAGAVCAAGMILSFHGDLPLVTLVVFGLLALLAARLLLASPWPLWLAAVAVAVAGLYNGYHVGQVLRQEATLPVADAVGAGALLAVIFYVAYRFDPADEGRASALLRVPAALALALAGLWRLTEYRQWLEGPVAADFAMGLARIPVLSLVLLLGVWFVWPRRRRFASQADPGAPLTHWALLGLAFFALPLGTLRFDIPFHEPDAPSAAEAGRVMETLLTDTYLAFNLPDENAAFDRLARNLSQDLVADVYLDSRRRLTAGTREGAEVTVRDVSVMGVDDAVDTVGDAFTYPCQWVVTARVRHLQHIHNRQNVYVGKLTLRVEDDRWKIAGLELLSEERVVLSWRSS